MTKPRLDTVWDTATVFLPELLNQLPPPVES